MAGPMDPQAFVAKWSASGAEERANKDAFLIDLCGVLGVAPPNPKTGNTKKDQYVFERDAVLLHDDGPATVGHIDLYKEGCFLLEAKQGSEQGMKKIGTARRGTPGWNIAMQGAYGQALGYAHTLDEPPPFIVTTDIGYCFELYAAFDGSGGYRAFPTPQTSRIYFKDLPDHLETFRAVFTDPLSLDPSRKAMKVTREVAAHLAELAKTLDATYEPERVAKFLMRCIFTMFAEDVGLLPEGLFTKLIEEQWLPKPASFVGGIRSLWKAMNEGGDYFVGKLLRFNGGLFKEPDALPLSADDLLRLQEAARCDWSEVEPAIFGTLLERALNPRERHNLGAHFTPRAYVERLVRPTIEEPLRADWDLVRAEARHLAGQEKIQDARKAVLGFLHYLSKLRVLDPACGTGNFLYVTLDIFKRLESEVLAFLSDIEGGSRSRAPDIEGEEKGWSAVTPEQFLGIEVKPWAKEIAELVLWIGYLQWHYRTHGRVNPPEPVLRDYGNIELRDAVLAYDREEVVRDDAGRPVTRWNGHTYKVSPVTGEDVPDETATILVHRYVNPRKASWPKADFIIANPPFVGNKRMRTALGDGYVETLRGVHGDVPETSDFVMYWWNTAAHLVRSGAVKRFGLITTNSISQTFSRPVVAKHLAQGLALTFAIPDHPWVDSSDGADVRIAMTVGTQGPLDGTLARVAKEEAGDENGACVEFTYRRGLIHPDLTVGPNVLAAKPLQANGRMSFQGPILVGEGFRLSAEDLARLKLTAPLPGAVRPYLIARDLMQKPERRWVIDFFGLSEPEARRRFPALMQHVIDNVKPHRDANNDKGFRERWWQWGRPRPDMREAIGGLGRFIVTAETSTHKPFVFMPGDFVADHKLYVIASDDASIMGVLSSRVHLAWALAAGGRLGVGNDPTWTNTTCFLPFPFPICDGRSRERIRRAGQALDAHRKRQQAEHPDLTLTGMYNVLVKLRAGEALTAKDKLIHDHGLVSLLRELHDEVDAAVLDAYGWPQDLTDEQVLERLVALNARRVEEEARGTIRWLRPDFQNPEGARAATQVVLIEEAATAGKAAPSATAWPKKLHERIAAIRDALLAGGSPTTREVAGRFKGAKRADVEAVLEGLAALGLAVSFEAGGVRRWQAAGRRAA